MKVLFTGQTGFGKEEIVNNLAKYALENRGLPKNLDDNYSKKYLRIFDIEGGIKRRLDYPTLKTFLDSKQPRRERLWGEELQEILNQIDIEKPEHVLLLTHATYFRDNHYFTCLNLDLLEKFQPTVILTLINDVYDIGYEVNKQREEKGIRTKTKLSVADVLSWRTAEIMLSRMLSVNIYGKDVIIPHFIVSVKQSIEMLYKLLFRRDLLRIYTGFPITTIRNDPKKIEEIGSYRKELNDRFTIFDPTTIDELRIFSGKLTPRLDLSPIKPMRKEVRDNALDYENELNELKEVIKDHIELRDYTYIDQSHLMTGYRAFWGATKYPSLGMDKEAVHAYSTEKGIYTVDPEEDDPDRPRNVFKSFEKAICCKDLSELIEHLEKIQKKKAEDFEKYGYPKTWEIQKP